MPHLSAALVAAFLLSGGVAPNAPPSPFEEGSTVIVWQWCDTLEASADVVDVHAAAGLEAAGRRWDEHVAAGKCHWIPPQLATTALLVNQEHSERVMVPIGGRERPAMVEVWLAAIEGVRPHGYVATVVPIPGEEA